MLCTGLSRADGARTPASQRILVTGATGRVGAPLVRLLLETGADVCLFCRDVHRARASFGERVQVAQGDLRDPDSVAAALDGVERVFLLAVAGPQQLEHERQVVRAATRARVDRIVKLSVLAADERSPVRLARWHRQAEKELEGSGVAHTILRPPFFMQNLSAMVSGGAIYTAAQDGEVAMIDVRDIAAAAVVALTEDGHEGQTYRVTGPEAVSFDEAARELSAATGRTITHVRVAPEAITRAMTRAGAPRWYAEDIATLHRLFATGLEAHATDTVKTLTGRSARRLDAFARDAFVGTGLRQSAPRSPGADDA